MNDGDVLADTFTTILDRYPRLATLGVVPLGISKFSREPEMRAHTREEAAAVCDEVEAWQATYRSVLGRRLVFAADEYYLLADRPFPPASAYEGFPQHENGIGIARAFVQAFEGDTSVPGGVRPGFFAWVEGAPAAGYRAVRTGVDAAAPARGDHHRPPGAGRGGTGPGARPRGIGGSASPAGGGVGVITGSYGAMVLRPLLAGVPGVRLVEVPNTFFGGNIGVAGLLTGEDVGRALHAQPAGDRYLLPDACLSEGRFLDGQTLDDLPQPVEVVPAEGDALRVALGVGT